jgi:polysaccharide pyruvyl transferase WcaK-like protein
VKTVLLHASYFAKNFGDVLLWKIVAERAGAVVGVDGLRYCNMPEDMEDAFLRGLGGIEKLGSNENIDAAIFCGGGYLMPPHSGGLRWEIRNFLRHGRALREAYRSGKVSVFGVGLGRIKLPFFRNVVGGVLSIASPLLVRDKESQESLSHYGVSTGNAHVVPDLALAYVSEEKDRYKSSPKFLGIHADFQGVDEEKKSLFLSACRDLILRTGLPIRFLVDCESKSSISSVGETRSQLGVTERDLIVYQNDCDEFLRAIGECAFVLTTKLHVGICATALGIPVASIAKHAKTKRFYNQVEQPWRCISTGDELRMLLCRDDLLFDVELPHDLIETGRDALDAVSKFALEVNNARDARN